MQRKFHFPFEIVIILAVLIPHLYAAFSPAASLMNWYRTDDAYYYFIVARNVAAGHGFTFDLINRTNGFHPLWLFINVPIFALAGADRVLPLRILVMVLAILNAATGVVVYRLLKKYFQFGTAALISMFWVLSPRIHAVTTEDGLEAGLNVFALACLLLAGSWFMDRVSSKRERKWDLVFVGLVGAFALFSRLDNIYTYIVVGVWLVFQAFPFPKYLVLDEIFIATGVLGSAVLRFGFSSMYEVALLSTFTMLALAMVIKPAVYALFGIYTRFPGETRWKDVLRLLLAVSSASAVLGAIMLALNALGIFPAFPRMMVVYDWAITLALILGSRLACPVCFHEDGIAFPKAWLAWLKQNYRRVIPDGFRYYLPGALLMVVYMTWNQLYFGTPMPISGQVKHWWSTLPNTVYGHDFDLKVFLGLSSNGNYGPWSLVMKPLEQVITNSLDQAHLLTTSSYWIALAIVFGLLIWGLACLFKAARLDWRLKARQIGLHALVVGCLIQVAYYLATSYPNPRSWYWMGEMLALVLFLAIILEGLLLLLDRLPIWKKAALPVGIILCAILVFVNVKYLKSLTPWDISAGSAENYLEDARGLEKYTLPGAIIGMTGGGTVAYWLDGRTIVNLDGLMNSREYLDALKKDRGTEFLDKLGITYIDGSEYMVQHSDPYMILFKDRLERIGKIRGLEGFTLFKYLNPLVQEN